MIEKVESHTQIILKSLNKWIKYQKLFSFNIFAYIDTTDSSSFLYIYFLFIYLAAPGLSCGMGDLVPWPGIEPGPPALGAGSLSHWTTREVPGSSFLDLVWLGSNSISVSKLFKLNKFADTQKNHIVNIKFKNVLHKFIRNRNLSNKSFFKFLVKLIYVRKMCKIIFIIHWKVSISAQNFVPLYLGYKSAFFFSGVSN